MSRFLRTLVGAGALVASVVACSAQSDQEISSSEGALSHEDCLGTADMTFCSRNAAQGAQQVTACWNKASAPWDAYLLELEAARDDKTHPELAVCAAKEKAKDAAQLRKECTARHKTVVCEAMPEAILRLGAEVRCYTQSPEYKAKNDSFAAKEAAYVAAGAGCVGLWTQMQMWNAGCFLLQKSLSSDKGTASAECLLKCPEPGPGGSCVPKRYRHDNNPVPCGVIRELDGVCECSEDTQVCARYQDAIDNPDGFMFCPAGTIGTPHVETDAKGIARLVPRCEAMSSSR